MTQLYVPQIVTDEALRIAGDMGGPEPTVAMVRRGTYRFTWADHRVEVYLDLRHYGRDRVVWAGSKLFVDGVEREKLSGPERFRMLWEGGSYEQAAELVLEKHFHPSDVLDEVPADDAPEPIRSQLMLLVEQYGADRVRYGRTGNLHTFAVDDPELQKAIRLRVRGDNAIVKTESIELWVDGENVSEQVGTDIKAALSLFSGGTGPAPDAPTTGPGVRGGSSQSKGFSGPDVRRSTVIRT